MKKYWLLIVICCFPFVLRGTEQPPYVVKDTATNENFRILFLAMSQHAHTGADDSARFDYLPLKSISNPTASNTNIGDAGVYFSNGYMVLFYNENGTMRYAKIQLNGSATTWTTGAP